MKQYFGTVSRRIGQWATLFSTSWKHMITRTSFSARKKPSDSKLSLLFTIPLWVQRRAACECGRMKKRRVVSRMGGGLLVAGPPKNPAPRFPLVGAKGLVL